MHTKKTPIRLHINFVFLSFLGNTVKPDEIFLWEPRHQNLDLRNLSCNMNHKATLKTLSCWKKNYFQECKIAPILRKSTSLKFIIQLHNRDVSTLIYFALFDWLVCQQHQAVVSSAHNCDFLSNTLSNYKNSAWKAQKLWRKVKNIFFFARSLSSSQHEPLFHSVMFSTVDWKSWIG